MGTRPEDKSDVSRLKSMLRYALLWGVLWWGGLMLLSMLLLQRFYFPLLTLLLALHPRAHESR